MQHAQRRWMHHVRAGRIWCVRILRIDGPLRDRQQYGRSGRRLFRVAVVVQHGHVSRRIRRVQRVQLLVWQVRERALFHEVRLLLDHQHVLDGQQQRADRSWRQLPVRLLVVPVVPHGLPVR